MKRIMIGAAMLGAMSLAHADTARDGMVSVKAGMWNWEQSTKIMGLFSSDEQNLECLIPPKAEMTLSRLAYDLDEGCTVEDVVPVSSGYNFTLICKGNVSGKAAANISASPESLQIRAKGNARWGIIMAGLQMNADATYMGECPADEFARQVEKWNEENPDAPYTP